MTVIDRIHSDRQLSSAVQTPSALQAVAQADAHLNNTALPGYSELVNTLLAWNRASDHCKAVSQDPLRKGQARTPADRAEVARLEQGQRDAAHRLNQLIDRLPRGL